MAFSRVAALTRGANARREVARRTPDADEGRFENSRVNVEVLDNKV